MEYNFWCYKMCLTKERKLELESIVYNFSELKKIDSRKDFIVQLRNMGFEVLSTDFTKALSGMILVNEHEENLGGYNTNKIIAFNSELGSNLYALRFVLAHELSHYISQKADAKGERVVFAVRDRSDRDSYHADIVEQEMDYMAAALLVPLKEFKDAMEKRKEEKKFDNCEDLLDDMYFIQTIQRTYSVDETLVKRRIKEVCEVSA